MSFKNILIGKNTFSYDWLIALKKINKPNIILIDFLDDEIIKKTLQDKTIDYICPMSNKDYTIIINKSFIKSKSQIVSYPTIETFELLNNKLLFTKFMMENFKHCIPQVFFLDNVQLSELEFPVISKPIYSTNGSGMTIYFNSHQFLKCKEKVIIQKFIDLEFEYAIYMLCDNGIILNHTIICNKYPKYTIKTKNFINYTVVKNFDITIFQNIIKKLNYSGGTCINFKFDLLFNNVYIFEINPRFGGSAFTNNFIYDLLCVK
jgi:predicted ATP-grasp superfamily ATP-dependent carboligase